MSRSSPAGGGPAPGSVMDWDVLVALKGIMSEGHSETELRAAMRMAVSHGEKPANGWDAIRLLRNRGASIKAKGCTPKKEPLEASGRFAGEFGNSGSTPPPDRAIPPPPIQDFVKDVKRRRRHRAGWLLARLIVFVAIPTFCAWIWFSSIASPLYATYSEFVIQTADPVPDPLAPAAMMGGEAASATRDAIAIQGFLESRQAFDLVDASEDIRGHLSQGSVDFWHRIAPDASPQQGHEAFRKHLDVSFDPTEGILKMRVRAFSPDAAVSISRALAAEAESRLVAMSADLRRDATESAEDSVNSAMSAVSDTSRKLIEAQEEARMISGDMEVAAYQEKILALETRLNDSRLDLARLQDNAVPAESRVRTKRSEIRTLEKMIEKERASLIRPRPDGRSLPEIRGEIGSLEAELDARREILLRAIAGLEKARGEARRQARHLAAAVEPSRPDDPEFPRPFQNTIMAFLGFLGIYLVASMTLSVIREQISA